MSRPRYFSNIRSLRRTDVTVACLSPWNRILVKLILLTPFACSTIHNQFPEQVLSEMKNERSVFANGRLGAPMGVVPHRWSALACGCRRELITLNTHQWDGHIRLSLIAAAEVRPPRRPTRRQPAAQPPPTPSAASVTLAWCSENVVVLRPELEKFSVQVHC